MKVQLDVFSGRPNPKWCLSVEDTMDLVQLLQSLPAGPMRRLDRGKLGYRGFILTPEGRSLEIPDEVIVYDGLVTVRQGETISHLADKKRVLEPWLLQTGRSAIDSDLCDELLLEMNNGGAYS